MEKTGYVPMDLEKSGKWIRFLCIVRGVSVKQICNMLGVSCTQSVYAWFNGRTMPSLDNLYGLSRILKTPIDELVLDKGESVPRSLQRRKRTGEIRMIQYYYRMMM